MPAMEVKEYCNQLADRAVAAGRKLMTTPGSVRAAALRLIAQRLVDNAAAITAANALDADAATKSGMAGAMLERLKLDDKRVAAMAESVRQIADQVDPIGQVIEGQVRPNGLRLQKIRVPIGVVLFIYESRPNVTSDAAALCIKSGNAIILRGGKEAIHSNTAIVKVIRAALAEAKIDGDAVQLVETTDRAAITELLRMEGRIDLCIPRGGESLIRAVVEQARIPVIKHYTGNCHVYVDASADPKMAVDICVNAKAQRPSVCNAAETLLFHRDHVKSGLMNKTLDALAAKNVEVRGDEATRALFPAAKAADEKDWYTEYVDLIVAVKVVDSLDDAVHHINHYGSKHTDAIVTADVKSADRFVNEIDAANVFVNCSTRLSDGGEYGLGAEIGISTDKLHARGPMGAADLTTYKWVGYGNGQLRS
ncbi:MAG: glutamate-5-semialdehyde dehydrogenase [Planctomycetes bacterium]|nr:glutamate-5-semialdehyde dehydrogenase [Planctomycetota bacterium]